MTVKTGWPPGLLQDDDRKLSRWFASRPDARYQVRKNMTEQPTAMRPIDAAYQQGYASGVAGQQHYIHAIETELRRMHSVNAQLLEALDYFMQCVEQSSHLDARIGFMGGAFDKARAAIAAAEREACAKLCERIAADNYGELSGRTIPEACARAIRARGEK